MSGEGKSTAGAVGLGPGAGRRSLAEGAALRHGSGDVWLAGTVLWRRDARVSGGGSWAPRVGPSPHAGRWDPRVPVCVENPRGAGGVTSEVAGGR